MFEEAVHACVSARMDDVSRLNLARDLVSARFGTYSVLHPWEGPASAFEHGRGFCVQYNGALLRIARAMGFDVRLVGARKVRMDANPDWTLGHVWVRVRLPDGERDLCASRVSSTATSVPFTPESPVRTFGPVAALGATFASSAVALLAVVGAKLRGRPAPVWVEHPAQTPGVPQPGSPPDQP